MLTCLSALPGCLSAGYEANDSDSNESVVPGSCVANGMWTIAIHRIQITGSCALNDCGHGVHGACGSTALMEIEESSGNASLDPMIAGLLIGITFDGTIDGSGNINTIHSAFPASSLVGQFDSDNCTMAGLIVWEPNGTCYAEIDITGEKN